MTIQLVYHKSIYRGEGTKEELIECPYCGLGDQFHKIAHAYFESKTTFTDKFIGGTKDKTNVYACNRCDELYPQLTLFIRRYDMAKKADLAEGQEVMVDEVAGFTIVKLMNLSAKVEDRDGKSKIVPYSQISTGKVGKKIASPSKEKEKPAPKNTSEKKKAYNRPNEDLEEGDPEDVDDKEKPAPTKQYKRKVGDDIGTLLDEAGTPTKMVDVVKKHKAYKYINVEAFKRTVELKNDLQSGLFKMRLSNMLRAAIRRMEK